MKIKMNEVDENAKNHYRKMPFDRLTGIVFYGDGTCRSCEKAASVVLIERLENFYGFSGFGNVMTGEINEMDAYLASQIMLSHGYGA